MIYSGIITSKNGSEIPLFTDGLPMHSKYNPEREAVQFAEGITAGFALVIGIGGAYHIAALLEKNTRIHILAVEADRESLSFCRQIECATKTEKDSRVTYTDAAGMQRALRELYKPAVYGNLCVLFNGLFCSVTFWKNLAGKYNTQFCFCTQHRTLRRRHVKNSGGYCSGTFFGQ